VVAVGTVTGSTTRRVGSIVKKGGDLLVFTLTATRDTLDEVSGDVLDLVNILAVGRKKGSKAARQLSRGSKAARQLSNTRKRSAGGGRRRNASRASRRKGGRR
jgi:hypothetical protein